MFPELRSHYFEGNILFNWALSFLNQEFYPTAHCSKATLLADLILSKYHFCWMYKPPLVIKPHFRAH